MTSDEPPLSEDQRIFTALNLESRIRSGTGWFYWIGALSLINSFIYLMMNGTFSFIFGLGITQVVDVLGKVLVEDLGDQIAPVIFGAAFFIDLFIVSIFFIIGNLARKEKKAIYVIGIVLYVLDGLLILFFGEYLNAAFHAYVLIGLVSGYRAMSELGKMGETSSPEKIEALVQNKRKKEEANISRAVAVALLISGVFGVIGLVIFFLLKINGY